MAIIFVTGSILIFIGLTELINRFSIYHLCSLCVGVSATWFLITAGILSNLFLLNDYILLLAILMGGTVVGIAYQGGQRFHWADKNIFYFRVTVILLGFILTYWAIRHINWITFVVEIFLAALIFYTYFIAPVRKHSLLNANQSERIKALKEKMKNCC